MKNLLVIFFISFLLPAKIFAQPNHVPNPSFEQYSYCPTNQDQLTGNCTGWNRFNDGSPDYFHLCGSIVGVPTNVVGNQNAANGNAYAGFVSQYGTTVQRREYITASITPMKVARMYEVSMSVSLADTAGLGTDDIGIYLSYNGSTFINTISIVPFTPQIDYSSYGPLTDKQNWVRMTKYFFTDSAYNRLVIGSFKNPANIDTVYTGLVTGNSRLNSYIYCDSIVIRQATGITINFPDTAICAGQTIKVPFTVDTFRTLGSNNVYTLQLSNASGSFGSPINIGTLTSASRNDTVTGIIPTNTPTGAGYIIRLVSSNSADTSFYKVVGRFNSGIKIGNPAKPSILSNSPLCSGQTLQFYGTIASGLSYSWSGPNSYTSSQQNPALTNATTGMSGNYILTASIYGCSKADTEIVVVNPSLQPITASVQSLICAGDTIKLAATNSSPTGASYGWTGPNSYTANTQNPTIPNAASGMNGDYIVTANLNGCIAKDTVTVAVLPKPSAVTIGSNSPLCSGATLQLTSTASTTGATYAWAGPNSFTANTQNSSLSNSTTAATGWYKITVALNGCSIKDSVFATVNATPAAPTASYNSPLCVGQTLNLSATNVTGATYSWTGLGGYTANTQNPTRANMQFGDTGMYNVTATVNGCTSPVGTVRIGINPSPFVVILANPGDSVCIGNPVVFTALPNNHGGTPLYQWYVNNSPVTTGSLFNTAALANGDVVRCEMTENTKCSTPYTDASNDITMNVLPWLAPSVTFTANPNRPLSENEFVTFTATSTNAGASPTYQWKRNGQNVQGATGAIWSANTLNDNDSISVEVVSSYKCPQPLTGSANGVRVKILSGIGGVTTNNGLMLYPNPNSGNFTLKGKVNSAVKVQLHILNAVGQVVYTNETTTTNSNLQQDINLGSMANGIYLLRIQAGAEQQNISFRIAQ